MADNVDIKDAADVTVPVASDDVGGVQFQKMKIDVGADGVSAPLSNSNPIPVSDAGGSLTVDGTVAISGAVSVNVGLTDAELRATAVPVSGPLTDAQIRATALPVSGPLTDAQIRASALPVSAASLPLPAGASTEATLSAVNAKLPALVSSRVPVDGSGVTQPVSGTVAVSGSVAVTGPLTDAQLRATEIPVSGTVTATGPLTDAQLRASAVLVSAASLPLPTGAATETTLSAINTKTPSLGQAAMAASVPVTLASNQSNVVVEQATDGAHYQPGFDVGTGIGAGGNISTDPDGNLIARSQVLTDELGFRANFANTSLSVAIGTCTFTNGSTAVTGTGFIGYDLRVGDYVKRDADGESAWVQVDDMTDTTITLSSAYAGTSGTSASSRAIVKTVTGTGASIAVASGACTLTLGTTAAQITEVERDVDWLPLVYQAGVTISQRIANQNVYVGFYDELHPTTPYYFAWFNFDGTTNTTVKCDSGRNPTGAPSAAETESTSVTLPNGSTTASAHRYRVEVLGDKIVFLIDGVIVATHYRSMPGPGDLLTATVRGLNGTTPATSTTVTVDYLTVKNHNKLEIGVLSDGEQIVAQTPAMTVYPYSVAGVITINTDLLIIDCLNAKSVSIHCLAMGTTGVVTPAWSSEPTFTNAQGATIVTAAGATATTFNAAGLWSAPVLARYLRLRLTTATTAGTTTINVNALATPFSSFGLATQPVSGTVTANLGTGGTGATAIGKAEDAAAASGDTGVATWGIRRDDFSGTSPTSAAGDYSEMSVNRKGARYVVPAEHGLRCFKSAFLITSFVATATDFCAIFGNATTTVEVRKVTLTAIATAAASRPVYLRKRTSANTGSTPVAQTAVRLNTADTAAVSSVVVYTASNPTIVADEGAIGVKLLALTTASTGTTFVTEWEFGRNEKPVTLIGTAQGLALNWGGAAIDAGLNMAVEIEWVEYVA